MCSSDLGIVRADAGAEPLPDQAIVRVERLAAADEDARHAQHVGKHGDERVVDPAGRRPRRREAARLQPASTGFGVDVGASAQQVRPTQPNTVVSPVQLGGTYTASTAQISPFFDRDLSDTLNLQARLTRSTQQNSGNGDNTVAVPLDTRSRDDRFSLTRRATPLGWGLEAVDTETDTRSGTVPRYGERNLRGLLSYAVGGNLLLTGVLGHARTQYADSSWNDPIHGARLQWRPSPQDYLRADVEQRYWGQSHHLDFTHTSGRLTLGVNRAREVSTLGGYQMAQLAARAATLASTSTDLAAAAVSSSIQNGVTLKQSTGVSAQYAVSRRDRLLLSSGIIQTSPLTGQSGVGLLSTTTQDTRQRYVSVGFEHMLSRQLTWTNSIRWDRITTVLPGSADTQFRETAWKSALNSILTPSTSATIGVQRDIQHKTATADKSDTQLFVGLNHKL